MKGARDARRQRYHKQQPYQMRLLLTCLWKIIGKIGLRWISKPTKMEAIMMRQPLKKERATNNGRFTKNSYGAK